MTTMTSYPEGLFSWVDLVAHDLDAAAKWYAELFGWEAKTQDTGGGPPYVMFFKDGHTVAGAGQMSDEMKAQGVPPLWNDYLAFGWICRAFTNSRLINHSSDRSRSGFAA